MDKFEFNLQSTGDANGKEFRGVQSSALNVWLSSVWVYNF